MTISRVIELLSIERECVLTASSNGCDRNCGNCVLVQNDVELSEMYDTAINLLMNMEYENG